MHKYSSFMEVRSMAAIQRTRSAKSSHSLVALENPNAKNKIPDM